MMPLIKAVTLILLVLGATDIWLGWIGLSPAMWGLYAIAIFWLVFGAISGAFNPLLIVEGADGRPSTSKFQFLLWTSAAIFSYVATYAARYPAPPLDDIPRNVMIAMGFSVTTLAAAKGIAVAYVSSGRITKNSPAQLAAANQRTATGLSALVQDDDGFVDLTKIQMLAWTFIALFVYLADTVRLLGTPGGPKTFADIDGALMVLMGLGQGAYLGKKLVTSDTPRITGVSKATAPGATIPTVTIDGDAFGANVGTVVLDGYSLQSQTWTDARITFVLPNQHPSGTAWPTTPASRTVQIGVIAGGQTSNTLPLTVSS